MVNTGKNKKEFVRSLSNVKLVIGNGFDLHCGLKTKYSDFFIYFYEKFDFINELYKKFQQNGEIDFDDERISKILIWDIFFVLNSFNDQGVNKWWCDVEKMMLSSFTNESDRKPNLESYVSFALSKIHWNDIKEYLVNKSQGLTHLDSFIIKFINHKMAKNGQHPRDFYSFLLGELKEFEKVFGFFIYEQQHDTWLESQNRGNEFLNEPYVKMAMATIEELTSSQSLVAIDSFNYGDISHEKIRGKLHHINSDCASPIFGIDTIFEPKDERFIFTKTARRIDSDLFSNTFEGKDNFENVVIFGHSLNEADYSYFFPLFDHLKLTDNLSSGVLVFAYDIYDKENETRIKNHLREAISNILFAYAVEKKIDNPKRLLDTLSTQKRIVTYEIPTININAFGMSFALNQFNRVLKSAKELKEFREKTKN